MHQARGCCNASGRHKAPAACRAYRDRATINRRPLLLSTLAGLLLTPQQSLADELRRDAVAPSPPEAPPGAAAPLQAAGSSSTQAVEAQLQAQPATTSHTSAASGHSLPQQEPQSSADYVQETPQMQQLSQSQDQYMSTPQQPPQQPTVPVPTGATSASDPYQPPAETGGGLSRSNVREPSIGSNSGNGNIDASGENGSSPPTPADPEDEKKRARKRKKGRLRELEEIRAELANKELTLLQKEQELLDKEQTLLVLKEELDLERKLRALLTKEKERAEEEAALAMGLCTGGAILP